MAWASSALVTEPYLPSVVLGVVGNIDFAAPLNGPILVLLILKHSGGVLAGFLAAGVFAAIMSSLDSQTLAAGSMFTTDIVRHYRFWSALHRKVGTAALRSFERLSDDGLVQRVVYGEGKDAMTLVVNFSDKDWSGYPARSATVKGKSESVYVVQDR